MAFIHQAGERNPLTLLSTSRCYVHGTKVLDHRSPTPSWVETGAEMAVWKKFSDEEITKAVAENTTYAGVIRQIGASNKSGSAYKAIQKRIGDLNLDMSHFLGQSHLRGVTASNRLSADALLVKHPKGSKRCPAHRLRRALDERGVPRRCVGQDCPNPEPMWRGEPLRLEVDHINGDSDDNRQANLRYLCPNCHSQTETYGFQGKQKRQCVMCHTEIGRRSLHCRRCAPRRPGRRRAAYKIDWPATSELLQKLETMPMVAVARELGVSDAAVKKHIRNHPVP